MKREECEGRSIQVKFTEKTYWDREQHLGRGTLSLPLLLHHLTTTAPIHVHTMLAILLIPYSFLLVHVSPVYGIESFRGQVVVANTPECKDDVHRLCKESESENFQVVECLLDRRRNEDEDVSPKCHNVLWNFKLNLTRGGTLERVAVSVCPELETKCPSTKEDEAGHLVACLIENFSEASTLECKKLLKKMEKLVFSDYRLVYKFTERCSEDITKFKCGRLDDGPTHNQGKTIECLEEKRNQISDGCQKEILRIAELQGEDFHLDRPLYFACRGDRDNLCPRVQSGDGRVYHCLMKHKLDPELSGECREQLLRRETLASMNYQVSRGLAMMCRNDIKNYDCRHDADDRKDIRLAQILLCLENALSMGHHVSGDCRSEMLVHRQSLMNNFQMTPNMVDVCHLELASCGKRLNEHSLHCLMQKIRDSVHNLDSHPFSVACRRMVEDVLKESNPGEDWRVDPELQSSCKSSVDTLCGTVIPGEGRVIACLMNHIDSTKMAPKCRDNLMLIQYFLVRDFELDSTLYSACHDDAHKYCHAKKEWHKNGGDLDPERGPTVMSCLFRYVYHPHQHRRLSQTCEFEVRRVMKQRAVNVELDPDVEDNCLTDLAQFCSEDTEEVTKKGFEMDCLQDHLENLSPKCRIIIGNLTEEESEHIELNPHLVKACTDPLKQLCSESGTDDPDHGDLMECLILNKHKTVVTSKCLLAIDHFQLIVQKDFRFSFKFKESCQADVLKYCKKQSHTKPKVVQCLSTIAFNDTFSSIPTHQRLTRDCRKQLKIELLVRNENVDLDPELSEACRAERHKFCEEEDKSGVEECLKSKSHELGRKCHEVLFKREKIEMQDSSIDYQLGKVCGNAISRFCSTVASQDVLFCLRDVRNDVKIEPKCRKLIVKRLAVQNRDYRLNSRLANNCERDISKFCSKVISSHDTKVELEGQVIACLKNQYTKSRLSQTCETEILAIIRESATNYQLDPVLVKECSEEISSGCSDETDVEECLKVRFQSKLMKSEECKEQVARLLDEGRSDIQSDVLLLKACSNDINMRCGDIPSGHGRHLKCLLSHLETKPNSISTECRVVLTKRVEMFEYAAQVVPAENIGQVVLMMADSPARNYFFFFFLICFAVIFFGGIFFGRITHSLSDKKK